MGIFRASGKPRGPERCAVADDPRRKPGSDCAEVDELSGCGCRPNDITEEWGQKTVGHGGGAVQFRICMSPARATEARGVGFEGEPQGLTFERICRGLVGSKCGCASFPPRSNARYRTASHPAESAAVVPAAGELLMSF